MAKRFTETEKWKDPWFCGLTEKERMFWIYLLDNCNHAGIWQVNWALVDFYINGFKFDHTKFEGRISYISETKWFICKFIDFQYKGELNPENRTHKSVLNILQKEGASKGLTSPYQGAKDKDKDKDKDKNKGIDKGLLTKNKFIPPTIEEVETFCKERENNIDPVKFVAHYTATGWMRGKNKIKNWKACVVTWERQNESR